MSGRMNPEKLAKLQEQVRLGGKGTPRRKVKKVSNTKAAESSAKMQAILKKVGTQPLANIDEVNMFCGDGKIIHFVAPKVQAAVSSNTFVITGNNKLKGELLCLQIVEPFLSDESCHHQSQPARTHTCLPIKILSTHEKPPSPTTFKGLPEGGLQHQTLL